MLQVKGESSIERCVSDEARKKGTFAKETPQQEGPTCGSVRGWPDPLTSTNLEGVGACPKIILDGRKLEMR